MSAHHLTRLADAAIDACDATDFTEHSAILSIARLKQIAQKNNLAAERICVLLKSLRRENIRLHAEGMSPDTIDAALKESKSNAIDAVRLAGVTDVYGELIQLSPDALERIIQPPLAAEQLADLVADTIYESVLGAPTIANLNQLAHISVTNPLAAVKIYILITRLAAAKSRLDRAAQEMYNNNQRAALLLDFYSESRDAQIEMQSAAFDILKQGAVDIIQAVRAADRSVVLHPESLRQVVRTLAPPMELIY